MGATTADLPPRKASSGASPRLPSPPPFTEVQIAPPPLSLSSSPPKASASASAQATRRIRPGTKARCIAPGPPPTSFSDLDSAFQLQEHLASLLASYTCPEGHDTTTPLSRAAAQKLATPPDGVEESLWCYELTRRLTRDLNVLIVALLNDNCTATSCPEMRASEWQYLCAVHEAPQSCCAIDYSTHTLDQAATMLTSTKYFPSRLSLHSSSVKHLASIFRRLYRIFAHAWFQHRHCFWEVEGEFGLYLFFKTVSDHYRLIPEDNLTLPPEAEGLTAEPPGNYDSEEEEDYTEYDRGFGTTEGRRGPMSEIGRQDDDDDDDDDYPDSEESESDDGEEYEGEVEEAAAAAAVEAEDKTHAGEDTNDRKEADARDAAKILSDNVTVEEKELPEAEAEVEAERSDDTAERTGVPAEVERPHSPTTGKEEETLPPSSEDVKEDLAAAEGDRGVTDNGASESVSEADQKQDLPDAANSVGDHAPNGDEAASQATDADDEKR